MIRANAGLVVRLATLLATALGLDQVVPLLFCAAMNVVVQDTLHVIVQITQLPHPAETLSAIPVGESATLPRYVPSAR